VIEIKILKLQQPNCAPCTMVSNWLDDNSVEYDVVDVTERPEVATQYETMSVPVTVLLDDEGNEVKRSTGFKPDELSELIQSL
jgi:thioredoxin 1